jgi:hypothetical protein
MQLEAAKILRCRRIRRTAEEGCKSLDLSDIVEMVQKLEAQRTYGMGQLLVAKTVGSDALERKSAWT